MMCGLMLEALLCCALYIVSAQTSNYVEVLSGDLNIILSSPHGGDLAPDTIPDRGSGCYIDGACVYDHDCSPKNSYRCDTSTLNDLYTQELTRAMRNKICQIFSACPPTIINRLKRVKLDVNREVHEGAFNIPDAVSAWNVYHGQLRNAINNIPSAGLVLDIHGHAHSNIRLELGYLISGSKLDAINFNVKAKYTSIRGLERKSSPTLDLEDLVRGPISFGAFLEANGRNSVPSNNDPGPHGESFFSGGYITRYYGSRYGGVVDAIQIESPREYRDEWENDEFEQYAVDIVTALKSFYDEHGYGD